MPSNTLILGSLAASGSLYTQDSLLFGKFSDATDFEVDSFISNTSGSLSFDFTNDRFSFNKPVSASVFYGDGSNLTGVSSDPFPYTGSLITSGGMVILNTADYTPRDSGLVGGYRIKTRQGIYVGVDGDTANAFGMHYAHNMIKYNNGYGRPSLTFGNSDLTFSHEANAPTFHASTGMKIGGGLGNKIGATGGSDLDLTVTGHYDASSDNNGQSYIKLFGSTHSSNAGRLILVAGNNSTKSDIQFYTTGSERMRITHSGSIGIGITDPQALLHINGDVSASTYYGDGSNLTGINPFPYTGEAQITGSLILSGSSTPTFIIGNPPHNTFFGEIADGSNTKIRFASNTGNGGEHKIGFAFHTYANSIGAAILAKATGASGKGDIYFCAHDGGDAVEAGINDKVMKISHNEVEIYERVEAKNDSFTIGSSNGGDSILYLGQESKTGIARDYLGAGNAADFVIMTGGPNNSAISANTHTRLRVTKNGNTEISGSLTVDQGLDITGVITASGNIETQGELIGTINGGSF